MLLHYQNHFNEMKIYSVQGHSLSNWYHTIKDVNVIIENEKCIIKSEVVNEQFNVGEVIRFNGEDCLTMYTDDKRFIAFRN